MLREAIPFLLLGALISAIIENLFQEERIKCKMNYLKIGYLKFSRYIFRAIYTSMWLCNVPIAMN